MMSKPTEEPRNIFTECKKTTEKFFSEIDKSSPVYQQMTTGIQRGFLDAWKNVINSSISIEQEYADKVGLNVSMPEETMKAIENMLERAANAYQSQNKFVIDSTEASKKVFDVFSENTKRFSALNKNMMELMASGMKKYS